MQPQPPLPHCRHHACCCTHHHPQAAFPALFKRILTLKDERALKQHERTAYLVFAINTFQSLEDEMVRAPVLKLVSLPLWHALGKGRLQLELHAHPQLAKHWKSLTKKESKAADKPGYVPVGGMPGRKGRAWGCHGAATSWLAWCGTEADDDVL
jgi:hypothetical protein